MVSLAVGRQPPLMHDSAHKRVELIWSSRLCLRLSVRPSLRPSAWEQRRHAGDASPYQPPALDSEKAEASRL